VKHGTVAPKAEIAEPVVTVLVRLDDLTPEVRERLLMPRNGEVCDCVVSAIESVVITDTRSHIERLLGRPISLPQLLPNTPLQSDRRVGRFAPSRAGR
jgi:hypothetical protein